MESVERLDRMLSGAAGVIAVGVIRSGKGVVAGSKVLAVEREGC